MLVPWKESFGKPREHIKKHRYHSADKVLYSQSYGFFPVIMYRCESWTIRKAECQIFDAFELWCWRRRLKVPWTARGSNKSILKEINPEYSLEGLTLKLQILWPSDRKRWLTGKRPWCWERLREEKVGYRGWDDWMSSLTQWIWVWANSRRWWRTGKPSVLQFMGSQRVGHDLATKQQQRKKVKKI